MARIMITLSKVEKDALLALSQKEIRDPRDQAALIIRQELARQGLIDLAIDITDENESSPKEKEIND